VNEAVVDGSVVAKWYKPQDEPDLASALLLRERALRGEVLLVAPALLYLEMLNAAARRWRWDAAELRNMAHELSALPFVITEPGLEAVARWASRGLSAYDASYVALAEQRGATLVTTDEQIVAVAPAIARHLRDYA
jgi:predicted nucleic acid-binding protein